MIIRSLHYYQFITDGWSRWNIFGWHVLLHCCCCRPHPSTENGEVVQQPFLRTHADGIPHLAGIRARWLSGGHLHLTSRCPTSTGAIHTSVTFSCVFMLVQLNKCGVVCGSHHHIESSNYLLPSLCACLSCIVEP